MLVRLYNVLHRKFGFIGYFGDTGSLIIIKRCALDGHVIHSKLSWHPQEVLLNEKGFDYGKNTHLAMTLFEHISHVQSGKEFSRIWEIFHRAADEAHGKPDELLPNPICLNTDCVSQLQTGNLFALRQEGQVTSRILYNNVVLLILFWLECKCKMMTQSRSRFCRIFSSHVEFL